MIKIFADGADLKSILELNENPLISGFTTNPSLMRKAGVENYETFAKEVLKHVTEKPVSFEIITDDLDEMKIQAEKIASWGENVYVKVPITNTQGIPTYKIISELSEMGVKLNVTAILTVDQIRDTALALGNHKSIISVFAGRIADTGVDPTIFFEYAIHRNLVLPMQELLWASTRELLNIKQAEEAGADIITVQNDLLKKMNLFGKDLLEYSRETVKMFYQDAQSSGYKI